MLRFFEQLIDPFPSEAPKQPPTGLLDFCVHYTQGIQRFLVVMAIFTAFLAIGEAMLYGLLGQLVDWLANKNPRDFLQQEWKLLLTMSVFVLIFIPLIVFFHSLLVYQTLMGNFPMIVRWMSHRYLVNQSYGFFQNEFSGRIATKVMQTSLAVRDSVMKVLDVLLFVSIYIATILLLVLSSDYRLSMPLFIWLAIYCLMLKYFVPRLRDIAKLQADARSTMTGRIVDSYTNIITLKLFSHNKRESDYVKEGMDTYLNTVHPQMRLVTWLNVYVWSLNMMLVFSTGALGLYLWMDDVITPGAIAIAFSLAIRLTGMSHWIMWEVTSLFENLGTVQDGILTLARKQEVIDKKNALPLLVDKGEIEFTNVDFSYTEGAPVFKKLNLKITAGEKIGIVGRSGSGKSTLVNILLRFYEIQSGNISIDDQVVENVLQESLRAQIAMVTQDTSLLHRSIRDNILFSQPSATEEEMFTAAKKAQAHEFILRLQDVKGRKGYDAHVGERGVTLSGGQRQRVSIARVLLKNAPILVLDEATSALDSAAESSIQSSLYQVMEGKTVIAIAHRLSTIAAMDRLIVLDEGAIVEEGTHKELLALNGVYAQLWSRQSSGFLGFI